MRAGIILIAVILAAGCTAQKAPVTEIMIPGHGNEVYTFSNDIRESLGVPVNDQLGIRLIGNGFTNMNIVFDGSSSQDNAYFRVVLLNFLAKAPLYYSYEGRLVTFEPYYYIGEVWYNSSDGEIAKPDFTDPVLWMRGPATGAADTSVNLFNNTIYLSGTSYRNLTLAGDKLTLVLFGIDEI